MHTNNTCITWFNCCCNFEPFAWICCAVLRLFSHNFCWIIELQHFDHDFDMYLIDASPRTRCSGSTSSVRDDSACDESAAPLSNVILMKSPAFRATQCGADALQRWDGSATAMTWRCNCYATTQTAIQLRRIRRRNWRRIHIQYWRDRAKFR